MSDNAGASSSASTTPQSEDERKKAHQERKDEAQKTVNELGSEAHTATTAVAKQQADMPSESQMQALLEQLTLAKGPDAVDRKDRHPFWNTQPVLDFDEQPETEGPIEADKPQSEVRQTPLPLVAGYEWSDVDIKNPSQLRELYELLSLNYVEDDDAMFRFDYSAEFIVWALHSPGWRPEWLVGVRVATTKRLVAFISAIPADLRIRQHQQKLVEINFLCVHKKLRAKRLAPVLIKEITRRVHVTNCFQAVYTAGIKIPRPISTCRYYHRTLNPKKLVETGFSHLGKSQSMALTVKLFKLPEKPLTAGFRLAEAGDMPHVHRLMTEFIGTRAFGPVMSLQEVKHWMQPRKNVVYTYVVQAAKGAEITDFVSFYCLPSSVISHPVHKVIKAAYLFYYAHTATPLNELIKDALIAARNDEFDVFNCLDIMENAQFLEPLLFGQGDGQLHYYLYNYRAKTMTPQDTGLVLL